MNQHKEQEGSHRGDRPLFKQSVHNSPKAVLQLWQAETYRANVLADVAACAIIEGHEKDARIEELEAKLAQLPRIAEGKANDLYIRKVADEAQARRDARAITRERSWSRKLRGFGMAGADRFFGALDSGMKAYERNLSDRPSYLNEF